MNPEDSRIYSMRVIYPAATQEKILAYLDIADAYGLDPIKRQIHFIENAGRTTIVVGIDGLRAKCGGHKSINSCDTMYCGNDQVWHEVWLSDEPPAACRVSISPKGCSGCFHGIAIFKECNKNTHIWRTMPSAMLKKVAEAMALRQCFPDTVGGLYEEAEIITDLEPVIAPTRKLSEKSKTAPAAKEIKEPLASEKQIIDYIKSLDAALKIGEIDASIYADKKSWAAEAIKNNVTAAEVAVKLVRLKLILERGMRRNKNDSDKEIAEDSE
jgi:phage recombination protein Bet